MIKQNPTLINWICGTLVTFTSLAIIISWPIPREYGLVWLGMVALLCLALAVEIVMYIWVLIQNKAIDGKRLRPANDFGDYDSLPDKTGKYVTLEKSNQHLRQPGLTHDQRRVVAGGSQSPLTTQETAQALPEPAREPITAQQALQYVPYNSLGICFGVDEQGQPVINTLPKSVHILLTASSGMGKSYLAQNILTQLITRNEPDKFRLALLDIEGETSEPFKDHAGIYATDQKEIVDGMKYMASELERRYREYTPDQWKTEPAPTWLVFIEEALDLRRYLDKTQLGQYADYFRYLAIRGRKRNIFMMAASQVEYSDTDFREAQGSFMSKLAGALKPTAATAMGFTNRPLINKLARDKLPGQFLLETASGDRLLRTPMLNRGDIQGLLTPPVAPMPVRRALEIKPDAGKEIEDEFDGFIRVYRQKKGIRETAAALGMTYYQGQKYYNLARDMRLID